MHLHLGLHFSFLGSFASRANSNYPSHAFVCLYLDVCYAFALHLGGGIPLEPRDWFSIPPLHPSTSIRAYALLFTPLLIFSLVACHATPPYLGLGDLLGRVFVTRCVRSTIRGVTQSSILSFWFSPLAFNRRLGICYRFTQTCGPWHDVCVSTVWGIARATDKEPWDSSPLVSKSEGSGTWADWV